ncbi:hypothetical protein C9I50_03965 [Pseudomonas prosekii]|nr:hypothetical protein C9I50_03965 [Pseudomonas prosekii]
MLAMAVGQSAKMLSVRTPSRASSAPTVGGGVSVDDDVICANAFASKLLSHGWWSGWPTVNGALPPGEGLG